MQTRDIRRFEPDNLVRVPGASRVRPERLQQFRRTAETIRQNHAAAGAFLDVLLQHAVERWASLLDANADVHTPQMLLRLASAAGEIEEDAPAEALAILDVARRLADLIRPSSFGYHQARVSVAAWRAAALADLGRFSEALFELRDARRLVSAFPDRQLDLATLLVERAYVHYRMGRREHVERMLRAALTLFERSGVDTARALRVYWLATSVSVASDAENEPTHA